MRRPISGRNVTLKLAPAVGLCGDRLRGEHGAREVAVNQPADRQCVCGFALGLQGVATGPHRARVPLG